MSLSRRRFFEHFMRPGRKSAEERKARYEVMEEYVRIQVLPLAPDLTEAQQQELILAVRAALEETDDEELFSVTAHFRVDEEADRQFRKITAEAQRGRERS